MLFTSGNFAENLNQGQIKALKLKARHRFEISVFYLQSLGIEAGDKEADQETSLRSTVDDAR